MNDAATNPTAADLGLRQDRLFNVLVHGSVILLSLLVVHFVVRWVFELSGFPNGKFPASFQFVLDWQLGIVERWPTLTAFGFLSLLWFDGWLYATFYRRFGRRPAQAWFFGIFILIVAALAFCLWASHSFLTGMIQFLSRFL